MRCGFPIGPVLRKIGITIQDSGGRGMTLSNRQAGQLIEACVERSRGEHFPFVFGECFEFEALPEVEIYLTTCATLRDAIRGYHWVSLLMSPALNVVLQEVGDVTRLRAHFQRGRSQPQHAMYFTESWIASILKLIRTLLGEQQADRLLFRHAAPPYARMYRKHFGLPVMFNQGCDAIELRTELLERPLHGALPSAHRDALTMMERRVSRRVSLTMADRVTHTLLGDPTLFTKGLDACAAALGLHVRTLQRRLESEGKRFGQVQADARFQMAKNMLAHTALDLGTISERLDFSDRRAFTRAFSRWADMPPSSFRKQTAQA